jgi:anaerobic magnesium-protoporphyrin IX monomethyl ester cyclase
VNKKIDCFLVGQNQITFQEYEKSVRKMGIHSGAYRDLNVNTLQLNNEIYSAADIFNLFCGENPQIEPIKRVETFAAGIAYLGTYLHRRGFTFDYINSFQDEKEYLKEQLQENEVLTVAILTTFYVTPLPIVEIIRFIRQYNQTAKILVGGPFVSTKFRTSNPTEMDYLLKSMEADFYVNSSQGESALVNIISSLKNDQPFDKINNIYYKTEKGYASTPLVREENILAENMVDWELFSNRVGEFANVRTCISCPFSCAFCGFPEHAGKHQVACVEAIEEELNRLNKIKSLKSIHFVDDTFNVPIKRFKEMLKMMIKNDYSFKWNSFFRCQYADEETVKLMKESGCESVLLGIESGNEQILKNMNKFASLDKYYEGIAWLKKYGIITLGNFIVGFPGETEETVRDTIDFIKKSDLDYYRAQLWYFEPITPIGRQKEKYDLQGESFEWSHKTMNSQQTCDWVERIIFSLDEKDKIRYPQYYFDYDNVAQLTHKGITMDQVKKYLKSFDNGVKTKLKNPSRREVTFESIQQIRESCQEPLDSTGISKILIDDPGDEFDTGEAEFDF